MLKPSVGAVLSVIAAACLLFAGFTVDGTGSRVIMFIAAAAAALSAVEQIVRSRRKQAPR
ncbi:hypothetical protein [Nakamurella leprariae]|uniref:Uncharacterized protein n=1 Tax=Nakamurella leprariae TaxID=2803911 RepID=A0A938YBD4_9ACTN|nr:hypothetical protein [Nakamurella leprariae]MBM9469396.1 hypothetical protein [Nakamurella leprariae]